MSGRPRKTSAFGERLRAWRGQRSISQLALAERAGTTARHVSFLETGRSRPGVELVLRLSRALEVPLRDRNALLLAAGLAPQFATRALDDAQMQPVARVLRQLLDAHEPNPAWVFRRSLRPMLANRAGERLFPGLTSMTPETIVDLWFGPGPFREMVDNWSEVVLAGVEALRRDASETGDPEIVALWKRAREYAAGIEVAETTAPTFPVVCPRFTIGGRHVRTISAVMRFDTAVEVTASELRVELMFPADDASAAFFAELAASAT